MPYEGGPKSGWRKLVPADADAFHALLCAFTGRFEISMFHTLSEGKTVQVEPGTTAGTATPVAEPINIEPASKTPATFRLMLDSSASAMVRFERPMRGNPSDR